MPISSVKMAQQRKSARTSVDESQESMLDAIDLGSYEREPRLGGKTDRSSSGGSSTALSRVLDTAIDGTSSFANCIMFNALWACAELF